MSETKEVLPFDEETKEKAFEAYFALGQRFIYDNDNNLMFSDDYSDIQINASKIDKEKRRRSIENVATYWNELGLPGEKKPCKTTIANWSIKLDWKNRVKQRDIKEMQKTELCLVENYTLRDSEILAIPKKVFQEYLKRLNNNEIKVTGKDLKVAWTIYKEFKNPFMGQNPLSWLEGVEEVNREMHDDKSNQGRVLEEEIDILFGLAKFGKKTVLRESGESDSNRTGSDQVVQEDRSDTDAVKGVLGVHEGGGSE